MDGIDIAPCATAGAWAAREQNKASGREESRLAEDVVGYAGYKADGMRIYGDERGGEEESKWEGREGWDAGGKGEIVSMWTVLEDEIGSKGRCVTGVKTHPRYEGVVFTSHLQRRDGKFGGGYGGTVCVWRVEEGRGVMERVLWGEVGVSGLEVVGGGGNVLMGGLENGGMLMWDTRMRSGRSVWGCEGDGEGIVGIVGGVCGGRGLWSAGSGGELCEWEVGVGRVRSERVREEGGREVGICCMGRYGGRRGGLVVGGMLGGVYEVGIGGMGGGVEARKIGRHEGMVMGVEGHWGKGVLEEVVVSVGRDWKARVWDMGGEGEGGEIGGRELKGAGLDVGWSEVNGSVVAVGEEGGVRVVDLSGEVGGGEGEWYVGLEDGEGVCKVGWGRGVLFGGYGGGRVGVWRCADGFARGGGADWVGGWAKSGRGGGGGGGG